MKIAKHEASNGTQSPEAETLRREKHKFLNQILIMNWFVATQTMGTNFHPWLVSSLTTNS